MNTNPHSFTLIELLITVTFILLFSGISIGYYSQYTEQKKLENAGRRISSVLTFVRQKTIAGDASMCAPQPAVTPEISYYSFEVVDKTTYKIQPYCKAGGPTPAVYTTEANIEFITPNPPAPIPVVTFFPVTGTSVCSYIYLQNKTLSGSQQCRYIKINQSGSVSENICDPNCAGCPNTCP